ncbi:Hint domain-containing protein [Sedimentitalea sp. HM32M-2]|uniref:Hint domain-containing protein n=1 Tax=Sedimentitalea sp. HM32M-2 TaxID=3351566 RepID=UPI003636ED31
MTLSSPLPRAVQRAIQSTPPALRGVTAGAAQPKPQLRRYQVMSLQPDGNIAESRHVAPALRLFEDAFCAFSRGSLVETEAGPVAVEDLLPGDRIVTAGGAVLPLLWKGSTTLVPGRPGPQGRNLRLTRIMADSFGLQRPISYVLTGPSARLLHVPDHLRALTGGRQMLTPVQQFQDGCNVIDSAPPTAVELFHLCLPRHSVIRVAGLEFETYHPGPNALRQMTPAMRRVFLDLFPHIGNSGDFGPLAHGRADDGAMDARDG